MSIKIGRYTLTNFNEKDYPFNGGYPDQANTRNKIWVETDSGEGGEFDLDMLEEVIKAFYNKNF